MGKEICIYNKVLQVFIGFLSHRIDNRMISDLIKEKQIEALQDFLEKSMEKKNKLHLEIPPVDQDFSEQREKVQELTHGVQLLEKIKNFNDSIESIIEVEKRKLGTAQEIYLNKLKGSARQFIEVNTGNSLFSHFIFDYFGLESDKNRDFISKIK